MYVSASTFELQRCLTWLIRNRLQGWEAGNGGGTHEEGPLHQACPQHPGAGFSPGQRLEGLGPIGAHTLGGKAALLLRCLVPLLPGPHPHKRAAPPLTRSCTPAFIPKSADVDLPWRRSDSLGRDTAAPLLSPDISLVGPHGNPVSAASPAPSGIQTSWSVTFGTQSNLLLFLRLCPSLFGVIFSSFFSQRVTALSKPVHSF